MARIKDYELDRELELQDRVLGTDNTNNGTMNFSLEQLGEFLASRGLADPSALDFQFRFAGQGTPGGGVQPGEIYYDELTPVDIGTLTVSATDLKGEPTGPFLSILRGTVLEINDTQASQGTNYGFFEVTADAVLLADESGYSIEIDLHPGSAGISSSTEDLPQTEFINLGAIGLAGSVGTDGLTPVITQPTPGEFLVTYQAATSVSAGDTVDVTLPDGVPGDPGNSVTAVTSTQTGVTPNTHTVMFSNSDSTLPSIDDIVISDGEDGTIVSPHQNTTTADTILQGITIDNVNYRFGSGSTPPPSPTFSTSLVGVTDKEGSASSVVTFTGLRPQGGTNFTYTILSASTPTANWAVNLNTGADPETFDVSAAINTFSTATVNVVYSVIDNNVNPPTHHQTDTISYQIHTHRGTFTGSASLEPQSYVLPANDIDRLRNGQTITFNRPPGHTTTTAWYALIAIPTSTATASQLTFDDGSILIISGSDLPQFSDTNYILYFIEVRGDDTTYTTTIRY